MPLIEPRKSKKPGNAILAWLAIITFTAAVASFFLLQEQAQNDVHIEKQRLLYLLIGVIISGICIISMIASSGMKN